MLFMCMYKCIVMKYVTLVVACLKMFVIDELIPVPDFFGLKRLKKSKHHDTAALFRLSKYVNFCHTNNTI